MPIIPPPQVLIRSIIKDGVIIGPMPSAVPWHSLARYMIKYGGYIPYEIESNGRTYRVKHFKRPCPSR